MIERFSLTAEIGEVVKRFGVSEIIQGITSRFNVAPTQTVSIVMNDRHNVKVLQEARWGLFPFWAKDSINADQEMLTDKPYLHRMLSSQRCVIPCSGFYGQKQFRHERDARAMHTVVPSQPLFGVAGIFDRWRHVNGKEVCAFTMLTAATTGTMSVWQSHVPVILDEEGIEDWMDPTIKEFSKLRKHLEAMESYLMRSYPVTNAVNDERYEAPDCIHEIVRPEFALKNV
ncbi:SOS response-associated peptidase [Paenibacillus sp. GSMTC-2017]|uniref:SOS response-associated peptidase n=1 Tax=Paenibacillus sp. GSMTC-2017 TaxID=2794350 RepID=UPI0018D70D52|nr:SOS response-associated peptidase [Paenibacillus sp. GSMTC-2017]MBH5318705.1 SOS response-associated peptidase [Paenibacillus sp. GSMTC-2017]